MSEIVLELFSEEIPAFLQSPAEKDLARLLEEKLVKHGIAFETLETFSGARRLTAHIVGVAPQSRSQTEARKGPRLNAPQQALSGFLRSVGLETTEKCEIHEDKRGQYYVFTQEKKGQPTEAVLAQILPEILVNFPWPKTMRWGENSFRWIRPLHRILCLFDGKPVLFSLKGTHLTSADLTEGHRVMGRGPFSVGNFAQYRQTLEQKGFVLLSFEERRKKIRQDAEEKCKQAGLVLKEDEGLLRETAGLVEWPVVMRGSFPEHFLALPHEILIAAMRYHQKYFATRKAETGVLAPYFIFVANLVAEDGGTSILSGNERVLQARLEDARYFWEKDLKKSSEERLEGLKSLVFYHKLGSMFEKAERISHLAGGLAQLMGGDGPLARQTARLVKTDLVSETVGEFPELQGVMGRYLYLKEKGCPIDTEPFSEIQTSETRKGDENPLKEARPHQTELLGLASDSGIQNKNFPTQNQSGHIQNQIANAYRDHYKPYGLSDSVPVEPLAIWVALADKFDTLAGFWSVGERPTGSKDPFALRRSALGVLRIILENQIALSLQKVFSFLEACHPNFGQERQESLKGFFMDRLKVYLRERQEIRYDVVDAVLAIKGDDLLEVTRKTIAIHRFLDTEKGKIFLAGYRRAINILQQEEKKDKKQYKEEAVSSLFCVMEETELSKALTEASGQVELAAQSDQYEKALHAASEVRGAIDSFFEAVRVNDSDQKIRENRLALLAQFRQLLSHIADFSKIKGQKE